MGLRLSLVRTLMARTGTFLTGAVLTGALAIAQQPIGVDLPRRTAHVGSGRRRPGSRDRRAHGGPMLAASARDRRTVHGRAVGRPGPHSANGRAGCCTTGHNLYIGLWCYDSQPEAIRASQRARDAELDPDDRVEIVIDPFENRRTAYFFQIGAGGSIGDILIAANGSTFDKALGHDLEWCRQGHRRRLGGGDRHPVSQPAAAGGRAHLGLQHESPRAHP